MRAPSAALLRGLWGVGSLALLLVALEIGAGLVYRVRTGLPLEPDRLRARIAARDVGAAREVGGGPVAASDRGPVSKLALHPYLGFVYDPALQPAEVNALGFRGDDPLADPGRDAFVVAIFGGSVAMQLPAGMLERKLAARRGDGRPVVVRNLGMTGYKQPQQLLALALLLSLGARFDAVVNLDGFNEVVLPVQENLRAGIHPAWPRRWQVFALGSFDERVVGPIARTGELQAAAARWQGLAGHPLLGRSRFVLVLANAMLQRRLEELQALDEELRNLLAGSDAYRVSGPPLAARDAPALLPELVRLWAESSQQMARLCAANEIAYWHFLQPNQHVEGSKPLTERERIEAVGPRDRGYREAATAGYALLVAKGRELARAGLPFVDLTPVFRGETETVYVDTCCHFNERGYEHVTDAIAERLAGRGGVATD